MTLAAGSVSRVVTRVAHISPRCWVRSLSSPVYFIGRHFYGRIAGATAAILIAILPGEFLSRSLLGFTDHHVTEAFFSTVALLFLMIALRKAGEAGVVVRRPADVLIPAHRWYRALCGSGGSLSGSVSAGVARRSACARRARPVHGHPLSD